MGGTRENRSVTEGGLRRPVRIQAGAPGQEYDSAYYDKLVAAIRLEQQAESQASELNRVAFGNQALVRYGYISCLNGYSVVGDTPQVVVTYTVLPGMIFHWQSVSLQFNPPDFHAGKMVRWRLTMNSGQIPGLQDVPAGISGHDNYYGQDINLWSEWKPLSELYIPGEATCSIEVTVSDKFEFFCSPTGIISGRLYMPVSVMGI
jgi:hypothetical protein